MRGSRGLAGRIEVGAVQNETRIERRLDRLIDRAQSPRSAAIVIAGVTTTITLLRRVC